MRRDRIVGALIALLVSSCAFETRQEDPSTSDDVSVAQEELTFGFCKTANDCKLPLPCRECSDGSEVCASVDCVSRLCVYKRPMCDAPPVNPCAFTTCPVGTSCVVNKTNPPTAECVPTDLCANVMCGAGTHCEAGACVADDPCAGVTCASGEHCVAGACVTDDPCATVKCTAQTHCEAGMCVPNAPSKVFCGGIAGIQCPGSGFCVDDPSDSCAPPTGADCGGMCVCPILGLCTFGNHWDASPSVCGCVPNPKPNCGANTCGEGTFCCNASCGICAPNGGACIQIACGP